MNFLTRSTLESLDLLIAGNTHPQVERDITQVIIDSFQNQPQQIIPPEEYANYHYIGAILEESCFLPLLASKNTPLNSERINCLVAQPRTEHTLSFKQDQIAINQEIDSAKYSLYIGQGDYYSVDLFQEPIPFDPAKEFFYVRSPNNSIPFENILSTCKLEEKIKLGEWMTYHNEGKKISIDQQSKYNSPDIFEEWFKRAIASKYTSWLHLEDRTGQPQLAVYLGDEENPWPDNTTSDDNSKSDRAHTDTKHATIKDFIFSNHALNSFDPLTFDPYNVLLPEIPTSELHKQPKVTNNYSLLYTSLLDLLKDKRWAFNNILQSTFIDEYNGFILNLNQHLVKSLFPKIYTNKTLLLHTANSSIETFIKPPHFFHLHETKFTTLEEKRSNALEMAA